jgi:hypothetical protein
MHPGQCQLPRTDPLALRNGLHCSHQLQVLHNAMNDSHQIYRLGCKWQH